MFLCPSVHFSICYLFNTKVIEEKIGTAAVRNTVRVKPKITHTVNEKPSMKKESENAYYLIKNLAVYNLLADIDLKFKRNIARTTCLYQSENYKVYKMGRGFKPNAWPM